MAVAVRSSTTGADTATNGVLLNKPTGTADGDLLLAAIYSDGTLATVPTGWTQQGTTVTVGGGFVYVHTKVAASEGASWTWVSSGTGASVCGAALSITGADTGGTPVTPITNGGSATATTAQTAPSVTPTRAGSLLISVFNSDGGTFTYSIPTGTTSVTGSTASINDTFANLAVFYEQLATTSATGTISSTCSASHAYNSLSLIVEPPASAAAVIQPPPLSQVARRTAAASW